MKHKILIVEDEPTLGDTLKDYLCEKSYSVLLARNCQEAKKLMQKNLEDLTVLLLDIGLPDGDGLSLAKELREMSSRCVLFFLSAQNDPSTRLEGLEIGAHDYITKPFELRELTLRLDRILETQKDLINTPEELQFGKLKIFFKRYQVTSANGKIQNLSQKECAILKLLYINKNQVVSRDQIIDEIWGQDSFPSNRTVDNYIVSLRKWSDSDENSPLKIITIRGIGYKLEIKKEI